MDRYARFANSGAGRVVVRRLSLPQPPPLRRYSPEEPDLDGPVLVGGAGRVAPAVRAAVPSTDGERPRGLVFDATGLADPVELRRLHEFFQPVVRSLLPCGRVIVFGTPPGLCGGVREAATQQALEGFVRSLGKEVTRGATVNLVYVAAGAEAAVDSTLRFLLSARSAYVSGQVISIGPAVHPFQVDAVSQDTAAPLAGRVAAVTGAARGIGAATARVLARGGATVIAVDLPAAGDSLSTVANDVRGSALQMDLAAPEAPARFARHVAQRHGRLDVLVHNAGITRDRTMARMTSSEWDAVLSVNLASQLAINDAVFDAALMGSGGRIVSLASVSGIAGTRGQTNYAASKAGVIGMVRCLTPPLRDRGVTVNAVAPGFIETRLTSAIPVLQREAGRRMNSMAQGGDPADVAETVAWLAEPGSAGITGNVVRVCGQMLLGA